jgi:hypothetical protein
MLYIRLRFRCHLCGRFASRGVSEKDPKTAQTRTPICNGCILEAVGLIAENEHPLPYKDD